jgi:hypothetical protein
MLGRTHALADVAPFGAIWPSCILAWAGLLTLCALLLMTPDVLAAQHTPAPVPRHPNGGPGDDHAGEEGERAQHARGATIQPKRWQRDRVLLSCTRARQQQKPSVLDSRAPLSSHMHGCGTWTDPAGPLPMPAPADLCAAASVCGDGGDAAGRRGRSRCMCGSLSCSLMWLESHCWCTLCACHRARWSASPRQPSHPGKRLAPLTVTHCCCNGRAAAHRSLVDRPLPLYVCRFPLQCCCAVTRTATGTSVPPGPR